MREQSSEGAKDPQQQKTTDELDPELIALGRPRTRVGAVLVLSVVVLSAYLMVLLRSDLVYYFANHTPKELGAATANMASLPDNRLVAIESMPDRSAPLAIEDKSWNRVMPFLGTSRSMWLRAVGERRNENPPYDERYVGRLRRLSDLKLAGALKKQLGERPPRARFLDARQLAKDVPGHDLAGDKITIEPKTLAQVNETVRDAVRVVLYKGETIPNEDKATAALVTAGLATADAPKPTVSDNNSWSFEVPAPDGINAVRKKVVAARLYTASVHPKRVLHKLPFADITPQADGLSLRGHVVPFKSIDRLAVFVTLEAPQDAFILLENEMPEQFWYVPFVYGTLLLVSLWLAFTLIRSAGDHAKKQPHAQDKGPAQSERDGSAAAIV